MIRPLLIGLAALILAGQLHAQTVCEMRGAEVLPELEEAKTLFLASEFREFADYMRNSMGDGAETLYEPLDRLASLVPQGFDSCQVVLQRKDVGGLIQEVSTFNVRGLTFPVSLYLAAIPVRDRWIIARVNFNTTFGSVLESVK